MTSEASDVENMSVKSRPEVPWRTNNFDLIRLLAAFQVLFIHAVEHLHLEVPGAILRQVGMFPGVTIFFVVSGYLISASYVRSRSVEYYFVNRFLRIFPGLWACFLFSLAAVWYFGQLDDQGLKGIVIWVVGNLSVTPGYTAAFLRDYGSGSVNGSLWTIPVEIQFYLALPLLIVFLKKLWGRWLIALLLALIYASFYLIVRKYFHGGFLAKLMLHTLPSWMYLFLVGMMIQVFQASLVKLLYGKFLFWFIGYIAWSNLLYGFGLTVTGNDASPLVTLPLACLVVSAAFTNRQMASSILGGNDISYGIYLYHMPIVNILLTVGIVRSWWGLLVCILASVVLACASWYAIERPALRSKGILGAWVVKYMPLARRRCLR